MQIDEIVNTDIHKLADDGWRKEKRDELRAEGAAAMRGFLRTDALTRLQQEAQAGFSKAYFNPQTHNIYLTASDEALPDDHIRNIEVSSSKGCICDDVIAASSPLKQLYHHPLFKSALCDILEEEALYPYADNLSSVNIHYARKGEELGWHFDNSSFAVTLMITPASQGGAFEYVRDVRDADAQDMGFEIAQNILSGKHPIEEMQMGAGDLLLFRGRNSLHRVTPVENDSMRQLAVLAYNNTPGISLSEHAQKTFYGRIGTIR
ncbi:MAG: 2OG-Fe(II) oxygenase [Alphaproteobacteria bacterium]|nr:2OG-Fe(II) oxygenase [Alphaproteobacteria bacterium]MBL6776952.1 2OG-Fe(II) oxygenase [Alphaproteobacteria bacterium]